VFDALTVAGADPGRWIAIPMHPENKVQQRSQVHAENTYNSKV